jgi:hypothetical protein
MRPGPAAVAEIILSTLPLDAPPKPLDDLIYKIIDNHSEWEYRPEDKASIWEPRVKAILIQHWNKCFEGGKQPRFAFNSISSYKVQGACFLEPCDSLEVKEQKLRRIRWLDYFQYLRFLSPVSFEVLCVRVLGLLGVPKPSHTPYRADQGIDFFGRMSIGDLTGHGPLFPVFESNLVVWLVGQAKHYLHSKVSTPDIRALVGSTMLGRSRVFPKDGTLEELKIRACDPVVMLFFTTGELSVDGWLLCRNAGVAAMDGEMLASFLADKEVGLSKDNGEPQFDQEAFVQWLGAPENLGKTHIKRGMLPEDAEDE